MFRKAQEVLYNFDVQSKAHILEFLGKNPITRFNAAIVLMLPSLTSV